MMIPAVLKVQVQIQILLLKLIVKRKRSIRNVRNVKVLEKNLAQIQIFTQTHQNQVLRKKSIVKRRNLKVLRVRNQKVRKSLNINDDTKFNLVSVN